MSMTEKPKILVVGGDRGAGKALKAQMELLEELEEYRAIGTVSEFRELKEKANDVCKWEDKRCHVVCGHGKVEYRHKVRGWSFCPYCGMRVNVEDWSKGKE